MAAVHGPFDSIKDIVHGRQALRLRVWVRIWEICERDNPSNVFSVEIVLVDAEGGRIQASIRKVMIRKFKNSIVEGGIYKMIYFGLIENGGEYRASFHQFKLLFQPRTRIFPTESEVIPRFGIQPKTFVELQETNGKSNYMFDFIGVLTVVREEKEFKKFGRPIRVLEIELTDDKGVMKCSLFGHFIQMMKDFLTNVVDELGQVSLNTVSNSTSIVHNGMDMQAPLKMIGYNYYSPTEEFLIHFPRKSIEDLHMTEEEGHFIFLGCVEGIVKDDYWWYMACKCHRYRMKLEVRDHNETAHFVLFDFEAASLLSKSYASIVGDAKVPTLDYPVDLDILIGKELLFKVEVKVDRAFKFDDSFKIQRTCDDDDIIREFKNEGSIRTPEKLKLKAPVNELFNEDDVQPGDETKGSEFIPVIDLYNEAEMSPLSIEECSSVAACLAPKKRKARRGAVAKKNVHAKVLKVEKD
ncbi:Nucleic acid-binding, OB-fold [Sesbania bispinosa]|nr:Nucleic acid-binding, OB-fold [Sesbania bispinosa]